MSKQHDLIQPFRGVRYNQSTVGELSNVICPPYDIISPENRVLYHKQHPCNFVHLVLGEEFETDNEVNNRFTRANSYLSEWIASGALRQDPEPSFYVYEQHFVRDGRQYTIRGFTCAVRLHEYDERVVLPHENTLAGPKPQLRELLRQTEANLDSVYGLYADEEGVVDEVLAPFVTQAPDMEALDRDDVQHKLWCISDPNTISWLQVIFADKQIAIADGHHRYETALAYRNERRNEFGESDQQASFDYVLMTLANVHQPDLSVLPTHRMVFNLTDDAASSLMAGVEKMFSLQSSTREKLVDDLAESGTIGIYVGGSAFLANPSAKASALMPGSEAYGRLDVNLLHSLILERTLGITPEQIRNQTCIAYTRDPAEAIARVDLGESQMAFLLNKMSVKTVLDLAAAGERLPQKATYFYPKLISGMCLRKLE